ncbi:hypothetical protein [Rhizomonospora bruguierae]|uniref:hypothetical protein n=1 Tax=Rhizomonospora bruguierae TaxID=1581705 RepID=UPI001BCE727F|nr:hypothetical protein [Micromonospora sp. NBRC 107566]
MAQSTKQVRVVAKATPTPGQSFEPTAFFDADGNPIDIADLAAAVADLTARVEALES